MNVRIVTFIIIIFFFGTSINLFFPEEVIAEDHEEPPFLIDVSVDNVTKGISFNMTGTYKNSSGSPQAGEQIEIYLSSEPLINEEKMELTSSETPIAIVITNALGVFIFNYDLPQDFPVGSAYAAARLHDTTDQGNSTNATGEVVSRNVGFTVSARTAIVVDEKYIDCDLYRGQDFVMSGRVYETYKGELTPIKIKPIGDEKLEVGLSITARGVNNATTQKVGNAFIGTIGQFQLRAKVPANLEICGEVNLFLEFNGNGRYEHSSNTTVHKLWSNVFFDMAEILSSFPGTDEKGRKAVFEEHLNYRSEDFREPLIIKVSIFEDVHGRAPPPVANAIVYLNFSENHFVNSTVAVTDNNGLATFEFISPLRDKDYPDRIKLLYREKERYVLEVIIKFVGNTRLQPALTSFNISYYPTPPPEMHDDVYPIISAEELICSSLIISIIIIIIVVIVLLLRPRKQYPNYHNPYMHQTNLYMPYPEQSNESSDFIDNANSSRTGRYDDNIS
jgi:hypothetical protein